ncbi:MAG TPA: pseudouridine-5'-phosphate glycosidase [Candidatus Stackebrandtia faecavium]|nr:pseudouridine-5'-phosphate glycosidase [Candidatus Stackebrandtia faecavium]
MSPKIVSLSEEVRQALSHREPVVALESTIIAHGLPRPRNLEVATEFESTLRDQGVVPATIAILDGVAHIGLNSEQLDRVANDDTIRKFGYRDLAIAAGTRASGATTVSATAALARQAGIDVFATGGLGGVHRDWTVAQDESADLDVLSRTRITVVCSGVKSILDVDATLQRLETLNVGVVGYRTDTFPGFYLHSSGHDIDWTVDSPDVIAAIMRAQIEYGDNGALVVGNPVATQLQLDPQLHERVLTAGLEAARTDGISGQDVTPYLLSYLVEHTSGASLEANLAAVRGNVALAGEIATAYVRSI